jgi:redox-sensing transcriptional repressor
MAKAGKGKSVEVRRGAQGRVRPLLKRLASYHQIVMQAAHAGRGQVSSGYLAELLHIDDSLVRKDMGFAGIVGRPKVGYDLGEVLSRLEDVLGLSTRNDAVLFGCGHLGTAVIGYPGFATCGLKLAAVFDVDTSKVGTEIAGHRVLAMANAERVIEAFRAEIAILTVPASAAQPLTDFLVARGVRAIWNFAPVILQVPPGVVVRNENLALGLARLLHSLKASPRPSARAAKSA